MSVLSSFSLRHFSLRDMSTLGLALRQCGNQAESMQAVSAALVACLGSNLGIVEGENPICAWIQFWKTHAYGELSPAWKNQVRGEALSRDTPCLIVLAQTLTTPEDAYGAIALHSESSPGFTLLEQARLPVSQILASEDLFEDSSHPEPSAVFQLDSGRIQTLQRAGFPLPQNNEIQALVGLWGLLPSNSCFITLLGLREALPGSILELFRPLALNIKMAILPFDRGTVFPGDSLDLFDFKSLATGGRRQLITRLRSQIDTLSELLNISEQATLEQSDHLEESITALQDTLTQLQRTQAQLIQSEKMSSLGQLVAGIAHEINNSVGFIYSNLPYVNQYLQDLLYILEQYQTTFPQVPPELQQTLQEIELDYLKVDAAQILNSMKLGTQRIRQMVQSLRNFSRLDEMGQKKVDLHEGIESTLVILHSRLQAYHIQVLKDYGDLPWIQCDPSQINQVLMNLLNNAIDAIAQAHPSNPTLHIQTALTPDHRAMIRITDNGIGIPETLQSKIFDPFFTTKPIGQGTGMGLFISYQIIVEKHQGQLTCTSHPEGGTTFTLCLPDLP